MIVSAGAGARGAVDSDDRRPLVSVTRAAGIALFLLVVAFAAPAEARRLALVIGNDSYKNVAPLKNARSDAKAIADALRPLGFEVTLKQDLTLNSMKGALREFKGRINGGDEVIFYFSGHGVQFEGTNYLVPVDIVAESEQQVADDSVPLQRVLDDLRDQRARFALAIVDACRDNPFKGQGRAIGGRGLAPVQAATGQMVVYSAAAGQEALDRLGPNDSNPNGVFTRVLIKQISRPGVPVDRILKNVQSDVVHLAADAHQEQVPAIYDQSIGDFYFRSGAPDEQVRPVAEPVVNVPTTPPQPAIHVPTAGELDELFWARIKDSTDVDDFKDYGRQFPKGVHSAEASLMARKLLRQAEASRPQPQVADSSAGLASEPVLAAPPAATGPRGSRSGNGSAAGQPGKLDAMMQQERQDFGVPATPQIHNGAMHGPTPTSIPGGQLITTKGVAALVQENRAPYLLLDALGGNTTLQGALPAAWAAQPGALGDSAEQELGQRLYQKTRGNRNVALVFFCASTHCWMSYNAALRAIDLGYRNVLWYRGGLEAWTDAGLPTVAGEQAY